MNRYASNMSGPLLDNGRADDIVRLGLTNPNLLASLPLRRWDLLIRQARHVNLLGRLHALLEYAGVLDEVPSAPRNHLEAGRLIATSQERVIHWELYCIRKALLPITEFVLLKGAAYALSGLPFARGRVQSDVDILVPKPKLPAVESALLEHGWVHMKVDQYAQQIYRSWSHELPPLYHPDRGTVLDVHHNILPLSGRLHPDAQKLLNSAEGIPGTPYQRLSPPDMVLHASAHMFQDGDLSSGLREIADIDGLIQAFSDEENFWDQLLHRAQELTLCRPLYYALRYCREFLKTPIPPSVVSRTQFWAPPRPFVHAMDKLVTHALTPWTADPVPLFTRTARGLLYMRSHWLKMPPFLLARHLLHQSFHRDSSGA